MRQYDALSQNDTRWKNDKLGTSDSSIGGWGCALVSCCIAARYYGHDILPNALDILLEPYYIDTNLMNWYGLTKIFSDITFVEKLTTFDDAKAKQYLSDPQYFVIACVDATPLGLRNDTHFFPLLGDGKILDVLDGKIKPFSTYPNYLGLRVYKGTPKALQATAVNYRGLDLTNVKSMQVCVDVWADLQSGKYLKTDDVKTNYVVRTEVEKLIKEGISEQLTLAEGYKKQFDDLWELILKRTPSTEITLHDNAKLTAYFEKYTSISDQLVTVQKEKEQLEIKTNEKIAGLQGQVTQLQTDLDTLQTRAKYLADELTQVQAEKKQISKVAKVIDQLFKLFRKHDTKNKLFELEELKEGNNAKPT